MKRVQVSWHVRERGAERSQVSVSGFLADDAAKLLGKVVKWENLAIGDYFYAKESRVGNRLSSNIKSSLRRSTYRARERGRGRPMLKGAAVIPGRAWKEVVGGLEIRVAKGVRFVVTLDLLPEEGKPPNGKTIRLRQETGNES